MEESADDKVIFNDLKIVFDSCKILRELHTRGVLRSKGIKAKQMRLRSMLKIMAGTSPLNMRPTQRRKHVSSDINSCLSPGPKPSQEGFDLDCLKLLWLVCRKLKNNNL